MCGIIYGRVNRKQIMLCSLYTVVSFIYNRKKYTIVFYRIIQLYKFWSIKWVVVSFCFTLSRKNVRPSITSGLLSPLEASIVILPFQIVKKKCLITVPYYLRSINKCIAYINLVSNFTPFYNLYYRL